MQILLEIMQLQPARLLINIHTILIYFQTILKIAMCFEVFQMSIPCTGRDTGIAGLELGLQIFNKNGRPIRGSPMKLKLKKQCNAIGQWNYLQLRRKSAFCITFVLKKKDLIRHFGKIGYVLISSMIVSSSFYWNLQ